MFKFDLDICVSVFQEGGYEVHLFRTMKQGDIAKHLREMDKNYDMLVVSGGDGTINIVVNAMMQYGLQHIPLGILASGTANDFAMYLGFKAGQVEDTCKAILRQTPQPIDIGVVNGEMYFINVCAGGLFTNVSQRVNPDLKNALGNLSYYLKGVEQLPSFRKLPFRIVTSKGVHEENLYFYMILNSAGTGGFHNLSPDSSIQDGCFEFVGIRAKNVLEISPMLLKFIRGEHLQDEAIFYLQDSFFEVTCLDAEFSKMESTLDGELGCISPFTVKVLPKAISVIANHSYL